jgi:hypothetical protein
MHDALDEHTHTLYAMPLEATRGANLVVMNSCASSTWCIHPRQIGITEMMILLVIAK